MEKISYKAKDFWKAFLEEFVDIVLKFYMDNMTNILINFC